MNQQTYQRIVSGQDQRLPIRIFRILLWGLSLIYGLVMRIRNKFYDLGVLGSHTVSVPVISIGNLTTGGTGKTPLVIWFCNKLAQKGLSCSILTRGYKTEPGQMTDEPAILAKACPDAHIVVNPDRIAGADKAIIQLHAGALVMDDGFQHRRLRRDLDIVTIDATCPFGYNRIVPAGMLREPVNGLKRASAAIITRYDQATDEQMQQLEKQIHAIAPALPIAKATHQHTAAVTYQNQTIDLEQLRSKPVFAFCGIGNPNAFFHSLKQSGFELAGTQTFNDHHPYTVEDMNNLFGQAQQCGAEVMLCTQKDWVKSALLIPEKEDFIFAYLAMELDFLDGLDKIEGLIDDLINNKSDGNELK